MYFNIKTIVIATGTLILSSQAVLAGTLNCEQGQEAICEEWCSLSGGGMSSNPDGSVRCTYEMKMRSDAKYDQKVGNDNDWILTMVHKSS